MEDRQEPEAQGYEVRVTKRGHVAVFQDGRHVVTFSGTPSDWRAMKNALAALKRAGFRWPPYATGHKRTGER
ncbi:MAG: hypothetical protein JWM84_1829 [Nocardioides sp.]|nr:hypothetical protein [Nocardioides sp.]